MKGQYIEVFEETQHVVKSEILEGKGIDNISLHLESVDLGIGHRAKRGGLGETFLLSIYAAYRNPVL